MGLTDDLSITIDPEHSLEELVDFILEAQREGGVRKELLQVLTIKFGLPFRDAVLAIDRVNGGRSRALTQRAENEPNAKKDPVAYISYHRANGDKEKTRVHLFRQAPLVGRN